MTELAHHPSYLLIEDQLDAVGQRYRVMRIVRGAMLWVMSAGVVTVAASMGAHFAGQGAISQAIFWGWMSWLVVSGLMWIVRPLLLRPRLIEVARMIETRVPGLHNGLTNSLLLAGARDLNQNPWLGEIFDEILVETRQKPIAQAVRMGELWRLARWLGAAAVLVGGVAWIGRGAVAHGWSQMWSPQAFVPTVGAVVIEEVRPKDVTLVAGQPLEITLLARGAGEQQATLVLGEEHIPLIASPLDDGRTRYAYRVEHIDQSTRYRLEVGGTQTPWFGINVVRQVKLTDLAMTIVAPAYTRVESRVITMKADDIGRTPITVLEGSEVWFDANVDVPVEAAMLVVGNASPVEMEKSSQGLRFSGVATINESGTVSILLTQGDGQIVAQVPDPALTINCTRDAAPSIEMKWPGQDVAVAPDVELKIEARLKDDIGVRRGAVLMGAGNEPLAVVKEVEFAEQTAVELAVPLELAGEMRRHGNSIRVQVHATDGRTLGGDRGPQRTESSVVEIRFRDPEQMAAERKQAVDQLRARLMELLKAQQKLHADTVAFAPGRKVEMERIARGQSELRAGMLATAEMVSSPEFASVTASFEDPRVVQKALLVLAHNPAAEAIDLANAIVAEPVDGQQRQMNLELQTRQRRIISTLESLLAVLVAAPEPTTQPASKAGGDLANQKEELRRLNEALREFIDQERKILDQTAGLAKKPVDNWDDSDRKLLEELQMAQEKLDALLQEKISDFSKLAEQDMANATLLRELLEVYSEVTMVKGALSDKAIEMAISLEESGVELAEEITSNIEKWLMDTPDRKLWTMEDPLEKFDVPMAELPLELEDMIGELMEEQEDLFDEIEDTDANWADSMDKGAGWDAADGPIANMSAKGATGNTLPNNNEMGGRSGEGRSGKSQGEFVEDSATGKGGRNTPTRLDPTAFQQGQIHDTSRDPVGGATGGGKISGQGGEGLEGPVPPQRQDQMQRLAQKQAQIRNAAERLQLMFRLGRYDNFKMMQSIAMMRRIESDLKENRYNNALRRRDILLDNMDASRMIASARVHVEQDTTPTMNQRLEDEIADAMKGELPAAWSEALREYYRKLARQ